MVFNLKICFRCLRIISIYRFGFLCLDGQLTVHYIDNQLEETNLLNHKLP